MKKAAILIADGCEEIEALTVVDILRRADITIDMISIRNLGKAKGSHGITFLTDKNIKETDFREYDALILPGGMPGTEHLQNNAKVVHEVQTFFEQKKLVAAICAAPTVLSYAGILSGKKAICYPGLEKKFRDAVITEEDVVLDGNVITSRGLGTAISFALAIIEYLCGKEKAETISSSIVYRRK